MKNLFLFLLLSLCAVVISCQKEIKLTIPVTDSTGTVNIPPSTNGDLLVKMYGKQGADSVVSYYTYDTNGRIKTSTFMTSVGGGSRSWYGYERNAAGLITIARQYVTAAISPVQADTSVTRYFYSNAVTPQIMYFVSTLNVSGVCTNDSTVYAYNSAGKPAKTMSYLSNSLSSTYTLSTTTLFTYDAAGNTTKIDITSNITGTATQATITSYTYDDKVDPLNLTEAESIVVNKEAKRKHNPLKQVLTSPPNSGAPSFTYTYSYVYNNANKPASAVSNQVPGNLTTRYTYYYQ